jgi:hypothetical protein
MLVTVAGASSGGGLEDGSVTRNLENLSGAAAVAGHRQSRCNLGRSMMTSNARVERGTLELHDPKENAHCG